VVQSGRDETAPHVAGGRRRCSRCQRPADACVCAELVRIANRTRILVLQHPRERRRAFGSARFVRLGLARAELEVCDLHRQPALLERLPTDAALLFPAPDAADLATIAPPARPGVLVVIDGTWTQAEHMLRLWPALGRLRRLRLSPSRPSQYRIRRQPRPECLSTLEAVIEALRLLEPETLGLDRLAGVFTRLIDTQLACERLHHAPRPKRRRRTLRRRLPVGLRGPAEALVVAFADAIVEQETGATHLVYWAATRPATRELFDCFIRPPAGGVSPAQLADLGLPPDRVLGGCTLDAFAAAWHAFLRLEDRLAAWRASTLAWVRTPAPDRRVDLKTLYCNLTGSRGGQLGALLARHRANALPLPLHGRAAQHLADAVAMAEYLRRAWREAAAGAGRGAVTGPGPSG
jgi:DTW domain-containing protein YfiP